LIRRSGMMDDYFVVRRRLESKTKKKKTLWLLKIQFSLSSRYDTPWSYTCLHWM
jgi:hypothetical protein